MTVSTLPELPALPALKSLGALGDTCPTIIVDTREQTPLRFTRLPVVVRALRSGDYSYAGGEDCFAVERKSVVDLIGCMVDSNRDRFCWELSRLRAFHFKRLLIVGTRAEIERGEYRSRLNPKVALNSLAAFEMRYGIPFVFIATPEEAAAQVEEWVFWSARETVLNANELLRANKSVAQPQLEQSPSKP